jgi:hypothetical protein
MNVSESTIFLTVLTSNNSLPKWERVVLDMSTC